MFVNLMAVLLSGLSLSGAHHQQVQGPCFAEPHVCGYPDPSNTGVPGGTELKEMGDVTLNDGDTLSDANVVGTVTVDGSGVTIEDSKIHATGGGSGSTGIIIEQGASDFTLLESEVTGNGSTTNAPESNVWNHYGEPGFRVIRSDLNGVPDNIEGPVTISNSYVIVNAEYPEAHSENIYLCGANANVQHSTLFNESEETSLIFGDGICGKGNRVTVENSLLAGGGYMLQPNSKGVSAPVKIVGNRVGRCRSKTHQDSGGGYVCDGGADEHGFWPRGGHYGIATELGREATWWNNVWDDTGRPVCSTGAPGCGKVQKHQKHHR
jgi:hypothetical protein